jgi:hypothetical protein
MYNTGENTHTFHSRLVNLTNTKFTKEQNTSKNKNFPPQVRNKPKKWVIFYHHSPLIRKIPNLLKLSDLTALRATNTIHQQLAEKIKTSTNSSGYTNSNATLATIHI